MGRNGIVALAVPCLLLSGRGRQAPLAIQPATTRLAGEVCFEPAEGVVDWRAAATAALGAQLVAHPDTSLLRQNFSDVFDDARLKYSVPVSPAIAGIARIILHEAGVADFRPTALRGEVTYGMDGSFRVNRGPIFTGEACAPPVKDSVHPTFVIAGQRAAAWTSTVVPHKTISEKRYAVTVDGQEFAFDGNENVRVGIRQTMVFRSGGTRLILAAWKPDDSNCAHQFQLFALGPAGAVREVGLNLYDCDV